MSKDVSGTEGLGAQNKQGGGLPALHVILVEPSESLNVGSVARAMSNLEFSSLHLVAPRDYQVSVAERTACWGADVLHAAVFHDSLDEALKPMQEVVGFTSIGGKHRPSNLLLHEWLEEQRNALPGTIALVFGPEDTGLREEHRNLCTHLLRIPSSPKNHSYNLAQAVLLALYEIRRSGFLSLQRELKDRAPMELFSQLDRILDEVMAKSTFTREGTPAPIPALVKNLFRRTVPDEREMSVLLALFSRINSSLGR